MVNRSISIFITKKHCVHRSYIFGWRLKWSTKLGGWIELKQPTLIEIEVEAELGTNIPDKFDGGCPECFPSKEIDRKVDRPANYLGK